MTCTQFMKATKITNVNLVENYFMKQVLRTNICIPFIKTTRIINVNHVANHFLTVDSGMNQN